VAANINYPLPPSFTIKGAMEWQRDETLLAQAMMQQQQMQMQQDLQTAEAAGKAAPALKAISE
jgi:hypothetical protein